MKSNARFSKVTRSCYLPHQYVKKASMEHSSRILNGIGITNGIFSQNYFTSLKGIATPRLLGENGPQDLFTNLLKTNFLNKSVTLDQDQLASTNTHNRNLSLSDQFSHSTTVAAKRRKEYSPSGLTVAALNINLSSLGPLYSSAGGICKEPNNSSNRVSRAASPALGSSADNNRFKLDKNY